MNVAMYVSLFIFTCLKEDLLARAQTAEFAMEEQRKQE